MFRFQLELSLAVHLFIGMCVKGRTCVHSTGTKYVEIHTYGTVVHCSVAYTINEKCPSINISYYYNHRRKLQPSRLPLTAIF